MDVFTTSEDNFVNFVSNMLLSIEYSELLKCSGVSA